MTEISQGKSQVMVGIQGAEGKSLQGIRIVVDEGKESGQESCYISFREVICEGWAR